MDHHRVKLLLASSFPSVRLGHSPLILGEKNENARQREPRRTFVPFHPRLDRWAWYRLRIARGDHEPDGKRLIPIAFEPGSERRRVALPAQR